MTNQKELLRRVATLEVAVGRLQRAIAGMANGITAASQAEVSCNECGNDFTTMKSCAIENCPCGLPLKPVVDAPGVDDADLD